MALAGLQFGSGLLESLTQVVVAAATLVLVLMLVALAAFAYKSLRGDGIRWPDEDETDGAGDGLRKGENDEEWEYY